MNKRMFWIGIGLCMASGGLLPDINHIVPAIGLGLSGWLTIRQSLDEETHESSEPIR